jgi:hypothetical protein
MAESPGTALAVDAVIRNMRGFGSILEELRARDDSLRGIIWF